MSESVNIKDKLEFYAYFEPKKWKQKILFDILLILPYPYENACILPHEDLKILFPQLTTRHILIPLLDAAKYRSFFGIDVQTLTCSLGSLQQ